MATITLQAAGVIDDTMIDEANPTNNYGTNASVAVGESSADTRKWRTLIQFDLSSIPKGSTINSAVLSLKFEVDLSTNARTVSVYRVLRNWVVGEATWNVYSTGNNWGTAGCSNTTTDRESSAIGSASVGAAETIDTWKDFTLTAASVQEMLTGGSFTNNGFLIQAATENSDMYEYYSSDNGTEGNNPKLVIDYTPPSGFFAIL